MGMTLEHLREDNLLFSQNLQQELSQLQTLITNNYFSNEVCEAGFEVEYFIIDKETKRTRGISLDFISQLDIANAVPEFSDSSFETNSKHCTMNQDTLSQFESDLSRTWHHCSKAANDRNLELVMMGTLPTGTLEDFSKKHLTQAIRYLALESTSQQRLPLSIAIKGKESLAMTVESLAIMGACCAFQIHFRVSADKYTRYYNTCQALAGPILSICCNSPILFGKQLWDESRIAFLEQVFASPTPYGPYQSRTIFGQKYISSIMDLFVENNQYFTSVLPYPHEKNIDDLWHMRLHGSTIYRWNRPVIGIQDDSPPHFRIEFRPLSSGPTLVDMMANAVLFFGLVQYYVNEPVPLEQQLNFEQAKANFYEAAQHGLNSKFSWLENKNVSATELLSECIAKAQQGIKTLNLNLADADRYINIIKQRLHAKTNGAIWQRNHLQKLDNNYQQLVTDYIELQNLDLPIHEWTR